METRNSGVFESIRVDADPTLLAALLVIRDSDRLYLGWTPKGVDREATFDFGPDHDGLPTVRVRVPKDGRSVEVGVRFQRDQFKPTHLERFRWLARSGKDCSLRIGKNGMGLVFCFRDDGDLPWRKS